MRQEGSYVKNIFRAHLWTDLSFTKSHRGVCLSRNFKKSTRKENRATLIYYKYHLYANFSNPVLSLYRDSLLSNVSIIKIFNGFPCRYLSVLFFSVFYENRVPEFALCLLLSQPRIFVTVWGSTVVRWRIRSRLEDFGRRLHDTVMHVKWEHGGQSRVFGKPWPCSPSSFFFYTLAGIR